MNFNGLNDVKLDDKGRLALPTGYREPLARLCNSALVLTVSPFERCLWLYPNTEWAAVEAKLLTLSDWDKQSRRIKRLMRGYARHCIPDNQGRILISEELREFGNLKQTASFAGQGNRFEIWDKALWAQECSESLLDMDRTGVNAPEGLRTIAL